MSVFPEYRITAQPVGAQLVTGLPFEFLCVPADQDTQIISAMLTSALDIGEAHTDRVFRLTSFTASFPCLDIDHSMSIRRPFVEIAKSPFVDVQEMRVFEQGNASATVIVPEIARQETYSRLFLPKTFNGILEPDRLYPIEVDFRAGYSTTPAPTFPELPVPPAIKIALQQHVAYLYENRGDVAGDFDDALPDDVKLSYRPVLIRPGVG